MNRKHRIFTWLWLVLLLCLAPWARGQAGWTALPQSGLAQVEMDGGAGPMALAGQARVLAVGLRDEEVAVLLDPDTGVVLKRIDLPGEPMALAISVDAARLYAITNDSEKITVVDTSRSRIIDKWKVGEEPTSLVLTADGSELIVATEDGKLLGLNASTGKRQRSKNLNVPAGELALGLQGLRLMVAARGTLVHLDAQTWSEIRRVDVADDIIGLAWWEHGAQALAITRGENGLSMVDAEAGTVSDAFSLAHRPAGLAADQEQDRAFVSTQSDEAVYRFDLLNSVLAGRYVLPSQAASAVFDPVARALYLAQRDGVVRLEPEVAQLQGVVDLNRRLRDIAADDRSGRALAVADKANTLYSVGLADLQALTLELGFKPNHLVVDSTRKLAVVAARGRGGSLRFVDLSQSVPYLLSGKLDVSGEVEDMVVDESRGLTVVTTSRGNLMLVDNARREVVFNARYRDRYQAVEVHAGQGMAYLLAGRGKGYARFDLVKRRIVDQRRLSFRPDGIAIDEGLDMAVLTTGKPSRAYLLDTDNQEILSSLDLPREPVAVAVQPDTHMAIVASRASDSLSLIDLPSRSLSGSTYTLDKPFALAVSARFNQALVLTAEKDDISIIQLPNPPPELTGLQPEGVEAGSPALTLSLTGKHFVEGAQVRFGQHLLPAIWNSHQGLHVELPATLLATPGDIPVSVVQPEPGGGESAVQFFAIRSAMPVLSTVSPAALEANGQPQVITLSGANFLPGPKVVFGFTELSPSTASDSQITATVPGNLLEQPGTANVLVRKGTGGDSNTVTVAIRAVAPEVTGLAPQSGAPGSIVTLTGRNFGTGTAANRVRFTGAAQDAHLLTASATEIKAVVPGDARTGVLTLTTSTGTGQSPVFTVLREQDFSLAVSPATLKLFTGSSTSLNILLGSEGSNAYTGLVSPVVKGLPAGVTARFQPPALSAGQLGSLILTAAPGAALGTYTPSVEATGQVSGGAYTVSALLNLTVQNATGETGVRGRFVTPEGMGIAGVIVLDQVTNKETQSDAAGNFLLTGLQAGTAHLKMDATPANPLYPIWPNSVEVAAGQIVAFKDWIISPPPADDKFTALQQNAAVDQVVMDERYPGLAVTIPAGTTIIGWDGVPKSRIAVERRLPEELTVPPPPTPVKELYHLYWGTPMGGIPSVPIPVTVPNVTGLEPGEQTELWYYYGSPVGGVGEWRTAGTATVSADGQSVASDPGVGIPNFCGTCGLFSVSCPPLPTGDPSSPDDCNKAGNPVELYSGYEMPNFGGLKCGGYTPLEVGLSYHPVDAFQGRSGVEGAVGEGWVMDYDIVLADANRVPDSKRLLLPPNSRINFTRQADGSFTAEGDPRFRGAILRLADGGSRAWDLTFKDGAKWHFGQCDPTGATACFLLEVRDAKGNVTQVSRRSDHKITAIGNGQRTHAMSYGASGYVEEIRDPATRTMRFTYNASKRIETITDAEGGVTRFSYVGDNEYPAEPLCPQGTDGLRLKTIHYPGKANPTENFHGTSRRVLKQVATDGREMRFEYQLTGACVTNINKPGEVCQGPACPSVDSWENYQAGWRIHGGQVSSTTVVDAEGNRTTRRYNAIGLAMEDQDAYGQATREKRDAQNRITESTDPLGRVTRTRYDEKSNPVLVTDPLGRQLYTEYDPVLNKPTRIVRFLDDGSEVATELTYDAQGNVKSVTDPLNHITRFTYTAKGQIETITDPLDNVSRLGYNAAGDLTSVTDPLGNVTRFTPDAVGRTVQVTDPLAYTAKTKYNGLDQVLEQTDPLGGISAFTYDTAQRPQSLTNPLNNTIATWGWDDANRLVSRADAHNQQDGYTYDAAGRLATRTDRKGQTATYTWDANDRLIRMELPDRTVTYAYDAVGNLIEVNDGQSRIAYGYDAADRLVSEEQDSGQGVTRIDYQYDTLDRVVQRTATGPDLPAPDVTAYAWDKASRLTGITYQGKTTSYIWDAAGRLTGKTLPNGIVQAYTWDAASRLTRIAYSKNDGTPIEQIGYEYDANGRRIAKTHGSGSAPETPFTAQYDAADRMTAITLTATGAGYDLTYDANGNLIGKTRTDGGESTAYTWDGSDRLTRIERSGVEPFVAEFQYDARNRRGSRTITQSSATHTTRYVYDGAQAIAEIQDGQVTTLLTGVMIDEAIARYSNGQERVQLADALGSVIALAKEDQATVTRYGYSPYGETAQSGETSGNASQYTGRENDGTGLYYYRARYYDPVLKRFIAEDPIGIASGLNLYSYVGGSPTDLTDPSGNCPWCVAAGIGALTDLAVQLSFNGFNLKCVSWTEVLISGAAAGLGVGIAQKLGKVSTAYGGANRPTYRFFQSKGNVRVESHPISRNSPDWYSYPHWHPDFAGKPWSKMHWPLVEPIVGVPAAAYNATKDDCECQK